MTLLFLDVKFQFYNINFLIKGDGIFDKLTNIAKLEYEKIMTDYNIQLIVDVNVKENYIVQFSK
jgi:hypothetical protein